MQPIGELQSTEAPDASIIKTRPQVIRPFGWVAVDKDGLVRREAWRRREFFGAILDDDAPEFDAVDLDRLDHDYAGCAPHRCVPLYAHPEAPAVPVPPLLTNDEIDDNWAGCSDDENCNIREMARAIEAAVRKQLIGGEG